MFGILRPAKASKFTALLGHTLRLLAAVCVIGAFAYTGISQPQDIPYLVKDINPSGDANPRQLTRIGDLLLFTAADGIYGRELWRSDGTEAGTFIVKDISPGTESSELGEFTEMDGILYFSVRQEAERGLWRSDGTEEGTYSLKGYEYPVGRMVNVNGTLYFTVSSQFGIMLSLWKSDGTEEGTVLLKAAEDLWTVPPNQTEIIWVRDMVPLNGDLYFTLMEVSLSNPMIALSSLWKTDGTENGTILIGTPDIQDTGYMTPMGDALYFPGRDAEHGVELWKSDGTEEGTRLLKDINPGTEGSDPLYLYKAKQEIYFSTLGQVWKSDGTENGTVLVKGGLGENRWPHNFTEFAGKIFFAASSVYPGELWSTDGTSSGTTMLMGFSQIIQEPTPDAPSGMQTPLNGTLYFWGNDGVHGRELWKTDGSPAGTSLVYDINPGSQSSVDYPFDIVRVGDKMFWHANDGTHGRELWAFQSSCDALAWVNTDDDCVLDYLEIAVGTDPNNGADTPSTSQIKNLFHSEASALYDSLGLDLIQGETAGEDVDNDGLADHIQLGMIAMVLQNCHFNPAALSCNLLTPPGNFSVHEAVELGFRRNLSTLRCEEDYESEFYAYRHALAALLLISADMREYWTAQLGLSRTYEAFQLCVKSTDAPFSGNGSLAGDGISNLVRFASGTDAALQQIEILGSFHSADANTNTEIDLAELLRVIQIYKFFEYSCDPNKLSDDGFIPGPGDRNCIPHASDYAPRNWSISLSELLRAVQFYNLQGYSYCPDRSEDRFCPGMAN